MKHLCRLIMGMILIAANSLNAQGLLKPASGEIKEQATSLMKKVIKPKPVGPSAKAKPKISMGSKIERAFAEFQERLRTFLEGKRRVARKNYLEKYAQLDMQEKQILKDIDNDIRAFSAGDPIFDALSNLKKEQEELFANLKARELSEYKHAILHSQYAALTDWNTWAGMVIPGTAAKMDTLLTKMTAHAQEYTKLGTAIEKNRAAIDRARSELVTQLKKPKKKMRANQPSEVNLPPVPQRAPPIPSFMREN